MPGLCKKRCQCCVPEGKSQDNRGTSSHVSLPFPFVKFLSLLRYLSIDDAFFEGFEIALSFNQIIIIFLFLFGYITVILNL